MNKIKYWIYYLKDKDEPYAYTDNKSYAMLFEVDRDMSQFKKIKKNMSKEEINYLAREYQNNFLKEVSLRIFDKMKECWFTGSFIMTAEESFTINLVEIQLMESELYQHCWEHPGKFKEKIYKALEVLEYNNVYRQITHTISDGEEDPKINVKPDSLGIFLHYYGKTMKGFKK